MGAANFAPSTFFINRGAQGPRYGEAMSISLLDDARSRALVVTITTLGNPSEIALMCRDAAQLSRAGRFRLMLQLEGELRQRLSGKPRLAKAPSKSAAKRGSRK